jgi:hypothetical protein
MSIPHEPVVDLVHVLVLRNTQQPGLATGKVEGKQAESLLLSAAAHVVADAAARKPKWAACLTSMMVWAVAHLYCAFVGVPIKPSALHSTMAMDARIGFASD